MGSKGSDPSSTVTGDINYYLEVSDGGTRTIYPGTAADKLRAVNTVPMSIADIRASDEKFTLDVHGFQFVPHSSKEVEFKDEATIKDSVYDETSELLKAVYVMPPNDSDGRIMFFCLI